MAESFSRAASRYDSVAQLQRDVGTELLGELARLPMEPEHVLDLVVQLVHSSRPDSELADDFIKKYVAWGAGPRASQTFTRAAKALALLRGRPSASIEEVKAVALPVLRHRIIPNYNATGEGVKVEDIVQHLVERI